MLIRGIDIDCGLVIISYTYADYEEDVLHDILLKCVYDDDVFYIDVDSLVYSNENVQVYTSVDDYMERVLPDCKILSVRDAK